MSLQAAFKKIKPNTFNILYFCFIILLPLIYCDKLVDPVLIPRQIYLSVFLLLTGFLICYNTILKKMPADFSFLKLSLPLLLLVFFITVLVSLAQSTAITESIYVLSKNVILLLFFIISTYLIIQKKINIETIVKSVITFVCISVIISIYQLINMFLSGYSVFEKIQTVNSTFANKNLFSSIIFLTLPFLLNVVNVSKIWKIMALFLYVLILILLWLIQTKAVIISFFLFLFVMILYFIINRKRITPVFFKIILTSSILIIIVASIISKNNKQDFSHLSNKHTAITRIFLWENSIEMIKDNFVFGVGAGNWQINFPKYGLDKFDIKEVKDGLTTFQRPHNDFLWVMCEMGIVGVLAYISVFLMAIYYLFKLNKDTEKWEEKCFYTSLFACLTGYCLIALVDFPLERIEHSVFLYLIFSIITAYYYNRFSVSKISKKIFVKPPLLITVLILPVVFSVFVSINRFSGEYHTHKLYDAHKTANWEQMIQEAEKADNCCYSLDPMSAPIAWYKGVALFSLGNINEAKKSFDASYSIHPYHIHVLNNLASCYESMGEHQKAVELYLKTLTISSQFEEARLNLSAVYFNMKDYEKAFETIDKCSIVSENLKYKMFLPVILDSWINLLLSKQQDIGIIKSLTEIKNTPDKIIKLYLESKKNNINFTHYILNYTD